MAHGLFVGLTTLDCIYRVERVPASDEKLVAADCLLAAGGPATNAAVAFAHWGHSATVLGGLGQHPTASLIQADLAQWGVAIADHLPHQSAPPAISTVLVTAATGERAVISRNAVGRQILPATLTPECLDGVDIVLVDGHQMAAGLQIARWARAQNIPVVIDGGSWKPGFEQVLPLATSVITSARFRLPGQDATGTLSALEQMGVDEIAMTQGGAAILFRHQQQAGRLAVPSVSVKDTLGAGDIFHGAFCHYRLQQGFVAALEQAAAVAARSCQFFGPRAWLAD